MGEEEDGYCWGLYVRTHFKERCGSRKDEKAFEEIFYSFWRVARKKSERFQDLFKTLLVESISRDHLVRKNYYNNNFSSSKLSCIPSLRHFLCGSVGWRLLAIVFTRKSLQVLDLVQKKHHHHRQKEQPQLNLFWLSECSVLNEIKY